MKLIIQNSRIAEAIAKAQSKRAVKRLKAKVIQVAPPVELIDTDALRDLIGAYQIPINLPQLMAEQDFEMFMHVARMAQEIEEEELLLLA